MDLSSLDTIGEDLWVIENTSLTSLDGLSSLTSLDEDFYCWQNTSLPTCEATELRDRLTANGWAGEANIEGNLPDECGE